MMEKKNGDIFKNQSGVALVIALIMIIVMTLVVLAASLTSIFEIKLGGNKRGATDAFFSADTGVQVVMSNVENFNLPGNYDVNNKYIYSKDPTLPPNPTKADITIYHNVRAVVIRAVSIRTIGLHAYAFIFCIAEIIIHNPQLARIVCPKASSIDCFNPAVPYGGVVGTAYSYSMAFSTVGIYVFDERILNERLRTGHFGPTNAYT